jgi:hypothetical protein
MSQPAGRIANPIFFLLPSVAFVLIALAAVPAFAASKQASKQAQERTARKACLGGDYNRGVNILADLFVTTKDPTYIFNQGRCFEQNHRYEDAISRFEEYLRVPDAKLSDGGPRFRRKAHRGLQGKAARAARQVCAAGVRAAHVRCDAGAQADAGADHAGRRSSPSGNLRPSVAGLACALAALSRHRLASRRSPQGLFSTS